MVSKEEKEERKGIYRRNKTHQALFLVQTIILIWQQNSGRLTD